MEIKNIRSRNDFIELLNENLKPEWLETHDVGEAADWYLAMQEAGTLVDCDRKDLASMLLDGLPSIKADPETAHTNFWSTYFEDVDYYRNEEKNVEEAATAEEFYVKLIDEELHRHFGDTLIEK